MDRISVDRTSIHLTFPLLLLTTKGELKMGKPPAWQFWPKKGSKDSLALGLLDKGLEKMRLDLWVKV